MISPRDKLDRARSARRLVLLATGASFAAAALSLARVPAIDAPGGVDRERQGKRAAGWPGLDRRADPARHHQYRRKPRYEGKQRRADCRTAHGRPRREGWHPPGDVITALNDQPVNDIRDLAKQIGDMAPGGTAKLTIWRKGEEKTISLTLGEMPKQHEARAAAPKADADRVDAPKLGLMLASAEHVAGAGSEGVIVIDLDRNGLAFEHGFKIGDIILDVGGKKVVTPVDVRNAVRDAHKDGKRVLLMRLKSDETTKFVAVPIARA